MMALPRIASLLRRSLRHTSPHRVSVGSSAAAPPTAASRPPEPAGSTTSGPCGTAASDIADPRIQDGVRDVDDEVDDHEGEDEHDRRPDDHRIVVGDDGEVDLAAHARPGVDGLGGDGPA